MDVPTQPTMKPLSESISIEEKRQSEAETLITGPSPGAKTRTGKEADPNGENTQASQEYPHPKESPDLEQDPILNDPLLDQGHQTLGAESLEEKDSPNQLDTSLIKKPDD
jgi:hypothetical protein